MALMRLDKILCDLGIASRSELRQIIKSGRVLVDGKPVTAPEKKFDPGLVGISLDGRGLNYKKFCYYMMDKPAGVLSATEDSRQKTVLDLLSEELRRRGLFPVGRLDKDTSGLLLLTNDGDFAHRVISPKSGIWKLYRAEVDGQLGQEDAEAFEKGLVLGDGTVCLPAKLEILAPGECLVKVTEGKYHQVKRMLASRNAPVLKLRRLAVGGLELDKNLGPGGFRELEKAELDKVFGQDALEHLT